MINIAIRATYYIFCCRNRNWDSPDLMQFWFFFFFWLLFCFVFVFVFVFLFLIIQSHAAFVNCLYVARFTIVHSKTQMKFPLLLLLLLLIIIVNKRKKLGVNFKERQVAAGSGGHSCHLTRCFWLKWSVAVTPTADPLSSIPSACWLLSFYVPSHNWHFFRLASILRVY